MLTILFFILGASAFAKVFHMAIQKGEVFGKWQIVLDWFYAKGWHNLEKFLGGCMKCFAHLWAIVFFAVFVWFNESYAGLDIGWWYVLVYIFFVSTVITTTLLIDKILKD